MTLDLDIGQSKKPKILMKNSIVYYEADTNSLVDTDTFYENFTKGPFKYYVIKEVGGWGGQMMMFDDKVSGWGWLNADVIKKHTRKTTLFACAEKKVGIFF